VIWSYFFFKKKKKDLELFINIFVLKKKKDLDKPFYQAFLFSPAPSNTVSDHLVLQNGVETKSNPDI
jgi:hypothetical protein